MEFAGDSTVSCARAPRRPPLRRNGCCSVIALLVVFHYSQADV